MALDYQTLIASASDYSASGNVSGVKLLQLALLKSIAYAVAPSMPTDYQSLLNNSNIAGYNSVGYACVSDLLMLSLLGIIAGNVSGGGGSSIVVAGNYAGGQPNFTPSSAAAVAIDSSNGRVWWYFNSTWN
jgi:hypothetical protein